MIDDPKTASKNKTCEIYKKNFYAAKIVKNAFLYSFNYFSNKLLCKIFNFFEFFFLAIV